jgi:hypothetical protein
MNAPLDHGLQALFRRFGKAFNAGDAGGFMDCVMA